MMTDEQMEILIEKYLDPKWREMARTKNFPEMLPIGFIDDLLDATKRMVEDERKNQPSPESTEPEAQKKDQEKE